MGGLIWLASYPKSGNTWLRAFLAAVTSQMPEQEFDLSALKGFNIQASHYACYHPFTEKTPRELTLEDLAALRPRAHGYMTKAHGRSPSSSRPTPTSGRAAERP